MDWTKRLPELSRYPRLARALWVTVAILVSWLHVFMNTLNLTRTDLILDDAGTWGVARQSLGTLLTLPTEFHSQPPLYYVLLHFLLDVSSAPWFMGGISWFFCWLLILFVLFAWHELSLFARVGFCLAFVFATMTGYLAMCVRPYGLATFLTLVTCVTFARLLRAPSRRNGIIYGCWATAMAYTMAFEVAVLLVQGLVVLAGSVAGFVQQPRAGVLRRTKIWLLTMLAVAAAYLPYLLLAYHYQYRPNLQDTVPRVFNLAVYTGTLREQLGFSPDLLACLLGLAVLGLVGELRRRNWGVLAWPLLLVGSIAFVQYFIVGRSPIGPQPKYMMPAMLAACALVALGLEQLRPRVPRLFWPVLVVLLAWLAQVKYPTWKGIMRAGPEVGPLTQFAGELQRYQGTKIVFNDVGYESPRHAYVTRDDPSVVYATMAGTGWAAGGENHLTDDYVRTIIDQHVLDAACFFYILWDADGPSRRAFVPAMERYGFRHVAPPETAEGHPVIGYCRK